MKRQNSVSLRNEGKDMDSKNKEFVTLENITNPETYGYGRVSSKGQALYGYGLEVQESMLKEAGATKIYKDVFSGTKKNRPELDKLLLQLKSGDTLIVCKLDRLGRTATDCVELVTDLVERGVTINILNMGIVNLSPMGRLMLNVMAGFAEFERDIIVERFNEGKAIAKQDTNYREGRKKKFTKKKIEMALEMLKSNSYRQVEELTGISKSTLVRAKREKETDLLNNGLSADDPCIIK